MISRKPIVPCLWFDTQAEDAARFYVSIFPNSKITQITRYSKAGQEFHKRPEGSVLTVAFELDGQIFTALNGGPQYTFTEAVSFQVMCQTQQQVDNYWTRLGAGGEHNVCGWLKDKFGLSWQIVPDILMKGLADPDVSRSGRVMNAMMAMTKPDVAAIERALHG